MVLFLASDGARWINDANIAADGGLEAQMPFGAMKGSGYGWFGGKAAIAEFTDLRWVTIEDANQHYPFYNANSGRHCRSRPGGSHARSPA